MTVCKGKIQGWLDFFGLNLETYVSSTRQDINAFKKDLKKEYYKFSRNCHPDRTIKECYPYILDKYDPDSKAYELSINSFKGALPTSSTLSHEEFIHLLESSDETNPEPIFVEAGSAYTSLNELINNLSTKEFVDASTKECDISIAASPCDVYFKKLNLAKQCVSSKMKHHDLSGSSEQDWWDLAYGMQCVGEHVKAQDVCHH